MTVETDIQELAGLAKIHPEIAKLLNDVVAIGRKLVTPDSSGIAEIVEAHQAPATITKETPEDEEWRRQTDRLIGKGLHEVLKLGSEAYRLTIPQFDPKLRSDGYDRFLAVDPRIDLQRLHQLLGIAEYIDTTGISNVISILQKPYVVCLQSGSVELFVGTFDQAMARIPNNGIATASVEVNMTHLQFPGLFQPWIDAGSSRCGADDVPCLSVYGGRPRVGAHWVGHPSRDWRLLSRGKKIGT